VLSGAALGCSRKGTVVLALTYLALLSALAGGSQRDWTSPETIVRAVPIAVATSRGAVIESVWMPMPGGGVPVPVSRLLPRETDAEWATLVVYCGSAGAESLTVRAVSGDGRVRVSRPVPCPSDGWVAESLRLEAVPGVLGGPSPVVRLEVVDSNRSPHHLVVSYLTIGAVLPVAPETLVYPSQVVSGPKAAGATDSASRLARARWYWIGGNLAAAEQAYSAALAAGATGGDAIRAEYERSCLPVPTRTTADRCALLSACTIRCAGTPEAQYAAVELAGALSELGRYDEAARTLDASIAAPRSTAVLTLAHEQRARILASQGDMPGALRSLADAQSAAQTEPDRSALRERARAWLGEAFAAASSAAEWPPEVAHEYVLWQAAQSPSPEALPDATPGSLFGGLALLKHGESKRATGDLTGALEVHSRLIRSFPEDPALVARARLYSVYAGGSARPEAIDDLRRLIVDFPGHSMVVAAAYLNIGERSLRADHLDSAVLALYRVAGCRSGVLTFELQATLRLAECYDRIGDADMAAESWREVMGISERRPDVAEFALAAERARRALGIETAPVSDVTAGPE